jgi:uncharacterized protein (TIGR02466 family)
MSESPNIYPTIFSIPLFCQKFSLNDDNLKSFCLFRKGSDSGRIISNVGGWQSNNFNLNKPPKELKEVVKCIFDFSLEICNFLNIEPVSSGQGWMNVNEYGHFNWCHTHPESALSGVYYVKTPNNCGNIEFQNPSMDLMTSMKVKKYNAFNSSSIVVPSEEGTMYIFPSWLPHKVHPNLSNEERISISFNLK